MPKKSKSNRSEADTVNTRSEADTAKTRSETVTAKIRTDAGTANSRSEAVTAKTVLAEAEAWYKMTLRTKPIGGEFEVNGDPEKIVSTVSKVFQHNIHVHEQRFNAAMAVLKAQKLVDSSE